MNGELDDHVDGANIGDLTTWPIAVSAKLAGVVDDWQESRKVARLWAGDAALWTGYDESKFENALVFDVERENANEH